MAKTTKAVIKEKKAEKIASLAAEASRMTKNAANTLDTFSDTMRVAEKYGKSAIKSADNIITEAGSKVVKAMETGGDIGKEASKAVKSAETAVSAGGLRLSTKVDDAADALKTADFYAGSKGVARSLDEYDAFVESVSKTNWEAHNVVNYAKYKEILRTAEAANPLVESLRTTGKLPANYITKADAMSNGWKPGKALNNFVEGAQIGGDTFLNKGGVLPNAIGREWYEADVGLSNKISRAKQAGTRLLYSNDGLLYITYDHYKTAYSIGVWK